MTHPISIFVRLFVVTIAVASTPVAPQAVLGEEPKPAAEVQVRGLGEERAAFTPKTLRDLPRVTVEAKDRDGTTHKYEGVELHEILRKVKAPVADDLRGPRMREFVTVAGRDGYTVVFSLPELSPAFHDRKLILADIRDGQPLPGETGPLRVIVPDDKRHSRWVRDVVSIEVLDIAVLKRELAK